MDEEYIRQQALAKQQQQAIHQASRQKNGNSCNNIEMMSPGTANSLDHHLHIIHNTGNIHHLHRPFMSDQNIKCSGSRSSGSKHSGQQQASKTNHQIINEDLSFSIGHSSKNKNKSQHVISANNCEERRRGRHPGSSTKASNASNAGQNSSLIDDLAAVTESDMQTLGHYNFYNSQDNQSTPPLAHTFVQHAVDGSIVSTSDFNDEERLEKAEGSKRSKRKRGRTPKQSVISEETPQEEMCNKLSDTRTADDCSLTETSANIDESIDECTNSNEGLADQSENLLANGPGPKSKSDLSSSKTQRHPEQQENGFSNLKAETFPQSTFALPSYVSPNYPISSLQQTLPLQNKQLQYHQYTADDIIAASTKQISSNSRSASEGVENEHLKVEADFRCD